MHSLAMIGSAKESHEVKGYPWIDIVLHLTSNQLFMGMTWSDVTVFQWQQLNELYKEYDLDNTKDISIKAVAIITNKTENEILKTPLSDTIKLISKIEFIKGEIPTKRVDYISTKNRRYRCNYNVKDMSAARYIESKHFVTDFTGNLHMIAASMIVPQKLTIFGWKDDKYDARKHEEYANDLLSASIVEVMGSVVFFYLVFRTWIKVFRDYLKQEIVKMGMSEYQAEIVIQSLCESMDGFIKPNWLQTMRKFHSQNRLNFQQ